MQNNKVNPPNWVHTYFREEHKKSQRILNKIKRANKGKKFKMVQVGPKTWKEVEVKDE